MDDNIALQKASYYLNELCGIKDGRRVGSIGNREAADFVTATLKPMGYILDVTPFSCLDHKSVAPSLECEGRRYDVKISPISLACNVTSELVVASTIEELEKCDCGGTLLLIKGDLCAEPLMPKNFPFYNPEHHQKIYSLIEEKAPAAVITATGKNPQMAAALYPYPVFEDGDFDIPSVFCTDLIGEEIANKAGSIFHLNIDAKRIHSTGCNVIARKNPDAKQKIVICAHIDAKEGTPGALDNATGIAIELLLAEMLQGYEGPMGIEIIAFNGEDYYSPAGQLDYLARYGQDLSKIILGINIDGAGYIKGRTAFSFYGLKKGMEKQVRTAFGNEDRFIEGIQWYQGDHMIFIQGGVPAIAITSENLMEILSDIAHTENDTQDKADPGKLVEAAMSVYDLITGLKPGRKVAPKQAIKH